MRLDSRNQKQDTEPVPFGVLVRNTLREWRLACPKGELDLVFPSGTGKVEHLAILFTAG